MRSIDAFSEFGRQRKLWADGQLALPYCQTCQKHIFYPRQFCPECHVELSAFQPIAGTGQLLSYTEIHRAASERWRTVVPFWFALVRLTEGPVVPAILKPGDRRPAADLAVVLRLEPIAGGPNLPVAYPCLGEVPGND